MLNLGSVLSLRTVLAITIIAASSLVSCVNVGERFEKQFVLLDDLLDGETTPLFALTLANQLSMPGARVNVFGRASGQSPPYPHRIDWSYLHFNAGGSLLDSRIISTDVDPTNGGFQEVGIRWDPVTAASGDVVVFKATAFGGMVKAGNRVRLRFEVRPFEFK